MAKFCLPNGEEKLIKTWKEYLEIARSLIGKLIPEISNKNDVVTVSPDFEFFVPVMHPPTSLVGSEGRIPKNLLDEPAIQYSSSKFGEKENNTLRNDSESENTQECLVSELCKQLPSSDSEKNEELENSVLELPVKDVVYKDLVICLQKIHEAKEATFPTVIIRDLRIIGCKKRGLISLIKTLIGIKLSDEIGTAFLVLSSLCGILLIEVKNITTSKVPETLSEEENKVSIEIAALFEKMCKLADVSECVKKITVFCCHSDEIKENVREQESYSTCSNATDVAPHCDSKGTVSLIVTEDSHRRQQKMFNVLSSHIFEVAVDSSLLSGLSLLSSIHWSSSTEVFHFVQASSAAVKVIETWKDFLGTADAAVEKVIPEISDDSLSVVYVPQRSEFLPVLSETNKEKGVLNSNADDDWKEAEDQIFNHLLIDLPELHRRFTNEQCPHPPVVIRGFTAEDDQHSFGMKSLIEKFANGGSNLITEEVAPRTADELQTDFLVLSSILGIVILEVKKDIRTEKQKTLHGQHEEAVEANQICYTVDIMKNLTDLAGILVPVRKVTLFLTKFHESVEDHSGSGSIVEVSPAALGDSSHDTVSQEIMVFSRDSEKIYEIGDKVYETLEKLCQCELQVNFTTWKEFVAGFLVLPCLKFSGPYSINLSGSEFLLVEKMEIDTEKLSPRKAHFHLPSGQKKLVQTWKDFVDTADHVMEGISGIFTGTNSVVSVPPRYEPSFPMSLEFINAEWGKSIKKYKQQEEGDKAEQIIYNQLLSILHGIHNKPGNAASVGPSILIRGLKIQDEGGCGARTLVQSFINKVQLSDMESDLLLLSSIFGIVVMEIKNITTKNEKTAKQAMSKAKNQAVYAAYLLKKLCDLHCISVPIRKVIMFYLQSDTESIKELCKSYNSNEIISLPLTPDSAYISQQLTTTLATLPAYVHKVDSSCWKRFISAVSLLSSLKFLRSSEAEIDTLKVSGHEMAHKDLDSLQTQKYLTEGDQLGFPLKKNNRIQLMDGKWYFLSNTQMNIMNDKNNPSKQLLVGPPGTGKTLLLMLRVQELVKSRESVAIFAPTGIREIYDSLIKDAQNCATYDLRELQYDKNMGKTETFQEKMVNTLSELVVNTEKIRVTGACDVDSWIKNEASNLLPKLYSDVPDLDAFQHVIIDELGTCFENFNQAEPVTGANSGLNYGFAKFMKQCERNKSIWMAGVDSCLVGNFFNEMDALDVAEDEKESERDMVEDYENWLNMLEKQLSLTRVNLGVNFRNSEKIGQLISMILPKVEKTYEIHCAHTIPGSIHYYDLTDNVYNPKILLQLEVTIKKELDYYLESVKLSRNQIKVLTLGNDTLSYLAPCGDEGEEETLLYEYWDDFGIFGVSSNAQSMEWPAVIVVLFSSLSYLDDVRFCHQEELLVHVCSRAVIYLSIIVMDPQWKPLFENVDKGVMDVMQPPTHLDNMFDCFLENQQKREDFVASYLVNILALRLQQCKENMETWGTTIVEYDDYIYLPKQPLIDIFKMIFSCLEESGKWTNKEDASDFMIIAFNVIASQFIPDYYGDETDAHYLSICELIDYCCTIPISSSLLAENIYGEIQTLTKTVAAIKVAFTCGVKPTSELIQAFLQQQFCFDCQQKLANSSPKCDVQFCKSCEDLYTMFPNFLGR